MAAAHVLVVDDERSLVELVTVLCAGEGYQVTQAFSAEEARERLAQRAPDLVLCDVMMPDGNGLDLLREVRAMPDAPAVVMMTAYTSTKTAIDAMKLGAADYVAKPFDVDELKVVLRNALETRRLAAEVVYLREELVGRYTFENIIGRSPRMRAVFSLVERVARTNSTVLLHGESGTGKELIARAIHFSSPRAEHRFLSINCGAMPESLLESELFGHERGAFTGAVRDKRGLFQEANRGTLFLDEIGEMSQPMQVKLLRALQDRTVRRVGGTTEETVDVRIIAATNRDLQERIARGEFREDLYYRINVIPIELPPLRERKDDIALLVDHFLRKLADVSGGPPKRISKDALRLLESHAWPGNVRELENLIERAVALSSASVIGPADFPDDLARRHPPARSEISLPEEGLDLEAYLDRIRGELMRLALERSDGVQTQAAELLGMTFRSFRYYAKKAGLTATGADEPG
ncbi:MAG: sigma-54 dependent transcriptional regulator [Thermoanaerobaculia bacterium]|nr:sigma-54 dependent transcriptional regulator [Thermoanaerobaculia bacterium]